MHGFLRTNKKRVYLSEEDRADRKVVKKATWYDRCLKYSVLCPQAQEHGRASGAIPRNLEQ